MLFVAVLEERKLSESCQECHQPRWPRLLGRIGNPWSLDVGVNELILSTLRPFTALPREDS